MRPLWLWIIFFLQISTYSWAFDVNDCPEPIQMQLLQDNEGTRPSGVVNLTCIVKGVSLSHVTSYWWILKQHKINKPLVIYHKSDSRIEPDFANIVEKETLTQPNGNIKTQLRLRVNMTQPRTYNCQIQTTENIFCGKDINITFADPMISIARGEGPIRRGQIINVNCNVKKAAGKPRISLGYTTTNNIRSQITAGNITINDHGRYFDGTQSGNLTVRESGTLMCNVTDDLGPYTASQKIDLDIVPPTQTQQQGENVALYASIGTVVAVVGIAAIIIIFWKKGSFRQLLSCDKSLTGTCRSDRRQRDNEDGLENISLMSQSEKAREIKMRNFSSRDLAGVRKPRSVLELVWAYSSSESEKRCEDLRRALVALAMNVIKKNRKNHTSLDLTRIRGDCFVVLLWDKAAKCDEAFQSLSLKMEVLEHGRDDTMAINVIIDESMNVSQSGVNQDYRYLMWFSEPDPKDMQALAKKIKNITQKQMSSLKGISNIVEGLVWSYLAVYLRTVLMYLKEKHALENWAMKDTQKLLHKTFLIIIPKSGQCTPLERVCAEGCYEQCGKLCEIQVDDAGMKGRRFDPTVHAVKAERGSSQKYYFVGEFANPVNTLHQLEQEDIVVDNESLINNFEQRLCYLLDHKNHGLHGVYEIIRFDDETKNHKSLNEVLAYHIKNAPGIEKRPEEKTIGTDSVHQLFVLNDCDDSCTDSGKKCKVHRVLSALEGNFDISIKLVTPFDFNQGGGKRIFNNLRKNAMLCFVWDKRSSKKQTLRTCLDIALKQNDAERRIMHVETDPGSLPITRRHENVISFGIDEPGRNERFQSNLKDLFLDQEDEHLCGLVGIGLALSFFYSYIAFKMAGWDDRLTEKAKYFKHHLHAKLIIIIPQSGRSLETIPGCDIIDHDKEKLTWYNTIRGNLAKLGDSESVQEYGELPALWVENKAACRNYTTTIYRINDGKQTYHAAVEYATPVRTLYVMYNTTHKTSNPEIGRLTDSWLQGEIKMLHTELTKLIADAKPEVNENIDLVYLEDAKWSSFSEAQYTEKASVLMKENLINLFCDKN